MQQQQQQGGSTNTTNTTSTTTTSHTRLLHNTNNNHNELILPQNVHEELREVQSIIEQEVIAPPDPISSTPKATISRSTYFRAKRNLRCNNAAEVKITSRNLGRPQKLSAEAEKVIESTLAERPTVELKQLQSILNEKCGLEISLASISRRLKAWGRSASQTTSVQRRMPRSRGPMVLSTKNAHTLNTANSSPIHALISDELGAQIVDDIRRSSHQTLEEDLRDLESFGDLPTDFNPDLASYESPEMTLNMLHDLEPDYGDLDPDKMTEQDMYNYQFDQQNLAHQFYDQAHLLYEESLPRFTS